MAIVIGLESQRIEIPGTEAVIGRSPTAQISLPQHHWLADRHAVLRLIAGRWLIEAQGEAVIRVGDGRPTKIAWLNPGDRIELADSGPILTFCPDPTVIAATPTPPLQAADPLAQLRRPTVMMLGASLVGAAAILAVAAFAGRGNRSANEISTDSRASASPVLNAPADLPAMSTIPGLESAVYVVLLTDPKIDRTSAFGMACAIGPRELLTSASVALEVDRARETWPKATIWNSGLTAPIGITDIRIHPQFKLLASKAEFAAHEIESLLAQVEGEDDFETLKPALDVALAEQLEAHAQMPAVDLAVLTVDRDVAVILPVAADSTTFRPGKSVTLAGYPWPKDKTMFDQDETHRLESVEGQISARHAAAANGLSARFLVKFGDIVQLPGRDAPADIWSGSPVVSGEHKVVGVYARPLYRRDTDEFDRHTHEVAGIGGLADLQSSDQ